MKYGCAQKTAETRARFLGEPPRKARSNLLFPMEAEGLEKAPCRFGRICVASGLPSVSANIEVSHGEAYLDDTTHSAWGVEFHC